MQSFKPSGVCANRIDFKVQDGIIEQVNFVGGCPGNLIGLTELIKGAKVEDIVEKFKGISCGGKKTSCPDQFAKALSEVV
ncbi:MULTISPECIES: TIGR03905 family TSCPD domain-containing protein [unclassified Fusibacter]|uniref:TIGR03905 family TSCPD domain-containing protein n=1 Tax=unclassified Fusibacter TaxID=2624464 RepID=UPI0010116858|nr:MULTISPECIES: TIGR03905 family TSCPD domain-containing protein [unclassified Fusibacter]MCK8058276.1 TIGR03905 family TSCPD domain-containing protein [Fusibacter sp. A2]NPE20859.1 TIGR03905 family TSCPD domain-containing protein [Fusibacter sp. A1]RXV63063.1 TIGR03905 family TSCPD domain-containing protein [Fusibacter sp. A1]